MSNFIAVNSLLSKNSLAAMHNELTYLKLVDRQLDNLWGDKTHGFRPGDTYRINRPAQFAPVIGNSMPFNSSTGAFSTNAFVEDPIFVSLSTNDQAFIPVSFNSHELTLQLDNEDSRVGVPAGLRLATQVEQKSILESALHGGVFYADIGSGSTVNKATQADFLQAQAILSSLTCPIEDRSVIIPPKMMADLAANNLTLFTPSKNEEIYVKGELTEFAGAMFHHSNLVPDYPAVPGLVAAVSAGYTFVEGATLIPVTFATTGFYSNGVIITFASKYRVNPETKAKLGDLPYGFAIATPASVFGNAGYPQGNGTIAVASLTATQLQYINPAYTAGTYLTYPAGATDVFGVNATATVSIPVYIDSSAAIYSAADSGNRQNITTAPAAGDTLAIVGSTTKSLKQALMFTKEGLTATVIPLTTDLPGAYAVRADHDGVSLRVATQAQVGTDIVFWRFDALSLARLLRDQYVIRILVG